MTRNLKALGLALVAVLAMSALAASAAHAEETKTFNVEGGGSAILTAEAAATQVFTVTGGKVECESVTVNAGTVEDGAGSVTVEPKYNNEENTCTASPIGKARVTTAGCHYTFSGTLVGGLAPVEISCPGEASAIKIDAALGCTITVPEQTVSGVSYTNQGGHILLEPEVTGITYTTTSACAFAGIKPGSAGTYSGNVTVSGDADVGGEAGEAVGISVE